MDYYEEGYYEEEEQTKQGTACSVICTEEPLDNPSKDKPYKQVTIADCGELAGDAADFISRYTEIPVNIDDGNMHCPGHSHGQERDFDR